MSDYDYEYDYEYDYDFDDEHEQSTINHQRSTVLEPANIPTFKRFDRDTDTDTDYDDVYVNERGERRWTMAARERTAEEWRADARGWEAAGVEVQDAARECWERALALEPDDSESLLRLGRIHLRDQRLRRARECFERVRAAGDGPARAEAEEGLGKVERAVQSAESGLESCRRILMVDSLNAPALACMAAHHQHLGDLREAYLKFEDALGFGEAPFPSLKDLGTVHVERGDDEEAVGCFGRLLKAEPDRASVWYLLAAALRRLGRRDQALDCAEKSLALWPEGAAARWLAALIRAEAAGDDPPAPPAPAGA